MASGVSFRSISLTSVRGVMIAPTGPVAEPHDARDHLLFAGLQDARVLGLVDEVMDLVLRHLLLGLAAAAEQREDQLAGEIQQKHQGSETRASTCNAGATLTAMLSGSRSATCFGTNSPTIRVA